MRGAGHDLLHRALDFRELVHQALLVVKASGRVDNHDVHVAGHGGRQRVVGHGGGVGAEFLLDYGHIGTPAPFVKLLDGGGAECVRGSEHDLEAGLGVHVRQLAYGGGLADAVDADDHDYVRPGVANVGVIFVLGEHIADFLAQQLVELVHVDVLVARGAVLDAVDDFQCRFGTYVAGYEDFLQLVEKVVVDGAAGGEHAADFAEDAFLGLFKTAVEGFLAFLSLLFVLFEEVEKAHWICVFIFLTTKVQKKSIPEAGLTGSQNSRLIGAPEFEINRE